MIVLANHFPEQVTNITDVGYLFAYVVQNLWNVMNETNIIVFGYTFSVSALIGWAMIGGVVLSFIKLLIGSYLESEFKE